MKKDEKNSKYFLGLENAIMIKNLLIRYTVYSNSQGTLINKQQDVLKELVDFYKELYTDNKKVPEDECFKFLTAINQFRKLNA